MALNKPKVMEAAQKLVEKGQTDKAIKEYLRIVQEDPKDVRVWLKIGDLYAKKGSRQEATETYQRVAQFYAEQGFYLKAVAVYKQILKLDPRLVDVNVRLAELYRQLGLTSDAVQQYEQVAAFYAKEGKTREALATIRDLADLDPENVATRIKLAELYSKEGMADDAITEFRRAAEYLRAQGRVDDFIKVAERLVWHQPENQAFNRELATHYLKRNDPRRALQKLQSCFKTNPRDVETLALLAEAFEALDQTAKTISVWKELARIHGENGERDKAVAVFQQILQIAPEDADALAGVGGKNRSQPPVAPPPLAQPILSNVTPMPAGGRSASASASFARVATPLAEDEVAKGSPTPGPLGPSGPRAPQPRRPTGSVPLDEDAAEALGLRESGATPPRRRSASPAHEPIRNDEPEDLSAADDISVEPEAEEQSEALTKLLAETDVYLKYGLHDKAFDHLRKIFAMQPGNVEALERLKAAQLAVGQQAEAIGTLARLVQATAPHSKEQATAYLEELYAIDPHDAQGRALAARFKLDARSPATTGVSPPRFDDLPSSEISLDTGVLALAAEGPTGEDTGPRGVEQSYDHGVARGSFTGLTPTPHTARSPMHEFEAELDEGTGASEPPQPEEGYNLTEETPRPSQTNNLEDDLDEADFFTSQNLFEEARLILTELLSRYPKHPLVLAKLADLDVMQGGAPAEVEPPPEPVKSARPERRPSVVAKLGEEDADTHWDLGLAYKEMGLYEEAIREFSLIREAPGRAVQCELMIGRCQAERGKFSEAISEFKKGLYIEGITELQSLDLYFEIGSSYEALGDVREALYYYEKVAKRDPRFREVERRVESLRAKGGAVRGGDEISIDYSTEGTGENYPVR